MSKHITHVHRRPCYDERACLVFVRSDHMHQDRLLDLQTWLMGGPCKVILFRYLSRLCQGSKGPCVWYQVIQKSQKKAPCESFESHEFLLAMTFLEVLVQPQFKIFLSQDSWLTPNEFQFISGRETAKVTCHKGICKGLKEKLGTTSIKK